MSSRSHPHIVAVGRRRPSRCRATVAAVRRRARSWRRTSRALLAAFRALPITAQILTTIAVSLLAALGANWAYHTVHKPTEVFFPLTNALDKQPFETWREYGSLFQKHATAVITPDLLAALAQVESAGNPVARTYWRWRPTWNPLELYRPASSAVGMFQITDATFQEGKRYCIHDHQVVQDGRWNDLQSCWFNSLYSRVLPSHAIEMTAALLDHAVEQRNQTVAESSPYPPAQTRLGRRDPSLWSRRRPDVCRTRLSAGLASTLRGPQCQKLSRSRA